MIKQLTCYQMYSETDFQGDHIEFPKRTTKPVDGHFDKFLHQVFIVCVDDAMFEIVNDHVY